VTLHIGSNRDFRLTAKYGWERIREFPKKEILENKLENGVPGRLPVSRVKVEENAENLGVLSFFWWDQKKPASKDL